MNNNDRSALVDELAKSRAESDGNDWDLMLRAHPDICSAYRSFVEQDTMPIITRLLADAYRRGETDAYREAAKDMREMERDCRDQIQEAYREGADAGDWR